MSYSPDITVMFVVSWDNGYETKHATFDDEFMPWKEAFDEACKKVNELKQQGFEPTLMSEPDETYYDTDTFEEYRRAEPANIYSPATNEEFEAIDLDELPF